MKLLLSGWLISLFVIRVESGQWGLVLDTPDGWGLYLCLSFALLLMKWDAESRVEAPKGDA